jgi:hypothetical protein
MFPRLLLAASLLTILFPVKTFSQSATREREIAVAFAPVLYQALGDKPRSDYITNFDFDGDWRGDNNWDHAEDKKFPLKGHVYYSVAETATHFFVHYAFFHPRDYKGGDRKGRLLSELIREGAKHGTKHDPTGWLEEAGVAHENDMEGCLIVAAKDGSSPDRARVVFVETLHHNDFSHYVPGETAPKGFQGLRLDGQRALLYVEPKGHGVEAYSGDDKQTGGKEFMVYKFGGKAEDPEQKQGDSVSYELVPIQTTLWARAAVKATELPNATFGSLHDYGKITIKIVQSNGAVADRKVNLGKLGYAFLGKAGGPNMARPPWAWFDKNSRQEALGLWFFDPATIIKRDFQTGESFSTAYLRLPFWANTR